MHPHPSFHLPRPLKSIWPAGVIKGIGPKLARQLVEHFGGRHPAGDGSRAPAPSGDQGHFPAEAGRVFGAVPPGVRGAEFAAAPHSLRGGVGPGGELFKAYGEMAVTLLKKKPLPGLRPPVRGALSHLRRHGQSLRPSPGREGTADGGAEVQPCPTTCKTATPPCPKTG